MALGSYANYWDQGSLSEKSPSEHWSSQQRKGLEMSCPVAFMSQELLKVLNQKALDPKSSFR